MTTQLKKETSTQDKVQNEIYRLSKKKKKAMTSMERVRLLQLKLYHKANQEESYRFYVLYDKLQTDYILREAYKQVRKNGGSPGVDNRTFGDIEEYGVEKFLQELKEELRTRTYRPHPVRRVMIEKENGGKRPLGIPTIKDRVAQYACKLIIEPIFESDFKELSYGFRPKRSAHGAIREIRQNLVAGRTMVYDADLSKYFDTIPHNKLILALKERISDPRIIRLIKQWLKTPIEEEDGAYTGGKKSKEGTPQGGVISPLLANVYMNLMDRIVNKPDGHFARNGIKMIRYADDFILMGRRMPKNTLEKTHQILDKMGLILNQEKSKVVNARDENFDFLGFTVRYDRSIFNKGSRFWNIKPRAKSEKNIRQNINKKLKVTGHYPPERLVAELNPIIRGWMNYYRIPKVSYTQVSFKKLDDYLRKRLLKYYDRKSQRKSRLYGQQAFQVLTRKYGLITPHKTSGLRPVNAL